MIIRADIERLRGDKASQLRAQSRMAAAARAWSADAAIGAVLRDITDYGAGQDLDHCPQLSACLSDAVLALGFVQPLLKQLEAALAEEPLGQIPFRHNVSEHGASLMLASEGRAQLLLAERAPGRSLGRTPAPAQTASVSFNMIERTDCVLSGTAHGRIAEQAQSGETPKLSDISLKAGSHFSTSGGAVRSALLIDEVEQSLVTLRLVRHPQTTTAKPSVEISLKDGAETRRAAGTVAESRQEMALTLLGAMGRADAGPIAGEMSRAGPTNLRWQALRQCLALDTARGFTQLMQIAEDNSDPLEPPAKALRDQLVAAHPALAQFEIQTKEAQLCPA